MSASRDRISTSPPSRRELVAAAVHVALLSRPLSPLPTSTKRKLDQAAASHQAPGDVRQPSRRPGG